MVERGARAMALFAAVVEQGAARVEQIASVVGLGA
jgi:hypothetical protein